MKYCIKCKQNKQKSEFSKNRNYKDGLQSICKSCANAYSKVYAASEKGRKTQGRYRASRKGKNSRKTYVASGRKSEAERKYYASGRGKEVRRKSRYKYPKHMRARGAVGKAIAFGKIKPAKELVCATCSNPAVQYHHHNGYAPENKLDVIPLCMQCHRG